MAAELFRTVIITRMEHLLTFLSLLDSFEWGKHVRVVNLCVFFHGIPNRYRSDRQATEEFQFHSVLNHAHPSFGRIGSSVRNVLCSNGLWIASMLAKYQDFRPVEVGGWMLPRALKTIDAKHAECITRLRVEVSELEHIADMPALKFICILSYALPPSDSFQWQTLARLVQVALPKVQQIVLHIVSSTRAEWHTVTQLVPTEMQERSVRILRSVGRADRLYLAQKNSWQDDVLGVHDTWDSLESS
jgi:hypothetical protein